MVTSDHVSCAVKSPKGRFLALTDPGTRGDPTSNKSTSDVHAYGTKQTGLVGHRIPCARMCWSLRAKHALAMSCPAEFGSKWHIQCGPEPFDIGDITKVKKPRATSLLHAARLQMK